METFGDVLVQLLNNVVFPALYALILMLVSLLTKKVSDKYGIEISEAKRNVLNELVHEGVAYVEELSARSVKAGGDKISSESKLTQAVAYVIKSMPELNPSDVEAYITSALAQMKGVGSTGEVALY